MSKTVQHDDWKSKYRDLLTEFEQKEGHWQKTENTLRGLASRVSIAAMGRDEVIDKHLSMILDIIKGRQPETLLNMELEGLAAAVLNHEQQEQPGDTVDIAQFIASLDIDPAEQKRFIDAVEAAGADQHMQALGTLATELNGILNQPTSSASGNAQQTIQEVLVTLIRHMHSVPGLNLAVDELKNRLTEELSPAALNELLGNLANAVTAIICSIDQDKQDLEAFLKQVTAQLGQFESWAYGNESDATARREDADSLEQQVEQQVGSLQGELENSSELDELKQRVQLRLDAIADQFKAYRLSENARAQDSGKRNALLLEEINQLKVRTHELAERCRQQESQLMHDALTGVYTRHAYQQRLQEEFQRWQRHRQPLCYSIWDIDHFKHVNDNFGHQTGDRLLTVVARLLADSTRAEDFVARIGGEEFVVLFPATNLDIAHELTDRLRKKIAKVKFHYKGTPIMVTISGGITEFGEGDTPETVYARADKALYTAKTGGRNRIIAN